MLSDMVDSVMVLNDEHCKDNKYSLGKKFKIFKKKHEGNLRNLIEWSQFKYFQWLLGFVV